MDESADIGANGYSLDTCKLVGVTRDGEYCANAPLAYEHRVANSPHSLFASSKDQPLYILKEGKVSVYPAGFTGFKVQKINYPTVSHGDSNIGKIEKTGVTVTTGATFTKTSHGLSVGNNVTLESWTADVGGAAMPELDGITTQVATSADANTFTLEGVTSVTEIATGSFVSGVQFPKEIEHIVVLGAAIKSRIIQLGAKRTGIPSAVSPYTVTTAPGLTAIDTSLATAISSFSYSSPTAPTAPGAPSFTYTAASMTLVAAPGISDLNLGAITAPTAPNAPTIAYSDASNADASSSGVTSVAVTAVGDMAAITDINLGQAPSYTKPSVTVDAIPSIDDLEIAATAPGQLTVEAISYSDASNSDATNADASATATGTTTVGAPTVLGDASFGSLPTAPAYTKPTVSVSTELSAVDTYIDTNEDIELAQAKLSKITAMLQNYQTLITDELNEFNKENIEYDALFKAQLAEFDEATKKIRQDSENEVQKIIKQADVDSQKAIADARATTDVDLRNKAQDQALSIQNKGADQALTLQNKQKAFEVTVEKARHKAQVHQSNVAEYQAQVNAEVTEYTTNELQKELDSWHKYNVAKLDQYAKDLQNNMNDFNKENALYQANLQAELKEMDTDLQKKSAEMNKDLQHAVKQADIDAAEKQKEGDLSTQVDLQNKAQDQVLDLQNKAKSLEAGIADWSADIQLYQQEVSQYQVDINAAVQEYTINEVQMQMALWEKDNTLKLQKYGTDIQNNGQAYKEAVDEYNASTNKFSAELQLFGQEIADETTTYKVTLDKFASELQELQAINNSIIQENTLTTQAWNQKNTLEIQNYGSQIQEYQAETGRIIQEHGVMTQELQALQAEYKQSFQMFVQKYSPQAGVQGDA